MSATCSTCCGSPGCTVSLVYKRAMASGSKCGSIKPTDPDDSTSKPKYYKTSRTCGGGTGNANNQGVGIVTTTYSIDNQLRCTSHTSEPVASNRCCGTLNQAYETVTARGSRTITRADTDDGYGYYEGSSQISKITTLNDDCTNTIVYSGGGSITYTDTPQGDPPGDPVGNGTCSFTTASDGTVTYSNTPNSYADCDQIYPGYNLPEENGKEIEPFTGDTSDEDTLDALQARVIASLKYPDKFGAGNATAFVQTSDDESSYNISRFKWKLSFDTPATCYLKVWLEKVTKRKGSTGFEYSDLDPFIWNGSGNPCVNYDDDDGITLFSPETDQNEGEDGDVISINIKKYSCLKGYEPADPVAGSSSSSPKVRPNPDPHSNGFPQPGASA